MVSNVKQQTRFSYLKFEWLNPANSLPLWFQYFSDFSLYFQYFVKTWLRTRSNMFICLRNKQMGHHEQSRWNRKISERYGTLYVAMIVTLPANFQANSSKFSSGYCIRSSERKHPRRFLCYTKNGRTVCDPVDAGSVSSGSLGRDVKALCWKSSNLLPVDYFKPTWRGMYSIAR